MAQFRVMTWNVENLFDVGDDDGPETEAALSAKLESLKAVIDALNPHVVALQEVGSETALARLQQALTVAMPHRRLGDRRRAGDPCRVHQPAAAARSGRHQAFPGRSPADTGWRRPRGTRRPAADEPDGTRCSTGDREGEQP